MLFCLFFNLFDRFYEMGDDPTKRNLHHQCEKQRFIIAYNSDRVKRENLSEWVGPPNENRSLPPVFCAQSVGLVKAELQVRLLFK